MCHRPWAESGSPSVTVIVIVFKLYCMWYTFPCTPTRANRMVSALVLLRKLSHVWFYDSDEAEPRVGGDRGGRGEACRLVKSPAAVHVLPYRDSIYMLLSDSRIVLLDCNWTALVMRAKVSRLWQIFLSVPLNHQRRTEYTVDWGGGTIRFWSLSGSHSTMLCFVTDTYKNKNAPLPRMVAYSRGIREELHGQGSADKSQQIWLVFGTSPRKERPKMTKPGVCACTGRRPFRRSSVVRLVAISPGSSEAPPPRVLINNIPPLPSHREA